MLRLLIFLSLIHFNAKAQDERFFHNLFKDSKKIDSKSIDIYKIRVQSSRYKLDLDRDGNMDSFQTEKRDGIDYIVLRDTFGNSVFEQSLNPKGANSSIFKAKFVKINHQTDVLLLHYYEGDTQTSIFEGSARLWILTIPNRNLKKAFLTQGPYFWTEKERANGKYWNRRYTVNTVDYNNDGVKEISVSFNNISKVYFFNANGLWKRL